MSDDDVTDVAVDADESDEAQQAAAPTTPAPPPQFTHSLDDLQGTTFAVAQLDDEFGSNAQQHLASDPNGWLVRVHGAGIGDAVADALKLSAVIEHFAKSVKWIGNAFYPGATGAPGIALAQPGHSIVLHFTAGLREEPVGEGPSTSFPSVVGGRYLAALMSSPESQDDLVRLLSPLGRRAVSVYTNTLRDLVDSDLGVNIVVPRLDPETASRTDDVVRVDFSTEEATDDLRFLSAEPRMVSHTEIRTGVLYALNDKSGRFSMSDEDTREDVTGVMAADVREELGSAWRKRIRAEILVSEPEFDWLPRARARTHRLVGYRPLPRRRN